MDRYIDDLLYASICVYHEARGESKEGQIAVAHVLYNRARKRGKTIKEIVYQPYQFSWTNKNHNLAINDFTSFAECIRSVFECLNQRIKGDNFHFADHYHADYISPPSWALKMKKVDKIGRHIFYKQ